MTIGKFEVETLFAEPICRIDIGDAITAEQVAYISGLKMIRNQVNLISEDLYIFRAPQLQQIASAVQEALSVYAREVMGTGVELYVTQSWAITTPPGVGMHGHSHSNSIVSGSLYYRDLPMPVARMFFERHSSYRRLEINPDAGRNNIFNTPVNVVTPRTNEILLFPSELSHLIEVNAASEPRHSIAFNTFFRGKIGNYRDVSELLL